MPQFTLSAWPLHPDGTRGEPLTQVSGESATECFAAMSAEVERWLSLGGRNRSGTPPHELELRLSWRGQGQRSAALLPAPRPRAEGAALARRPSPRRPIQCMSPSAGERSALCLLRPDADRRSAVGRAEGLAVA